MTSQSSRLTVVLSTDIKGYTALVQSDEAKALAMVESFQQAVRTHTASGQGEVLAFYGDGATCLFDSAIDAVRSALRLQATFRQNTIPARVGLHMGELVRRDGGIFGDAIKIAAEIEAVGVPGSILMSDGIQAELFNHPEMEFVSIGPRDLPTGGRMELFALTNEGLTVPVKPSRLKAKRNQIVMWSLAVLTLVIGAYTAWDYLGGKGTATAPEVRNQKIAIRFTDFNYDSSDDNLAGMTSHWLSSRIQEVPGSMVVGTGQDSDSRIDITSAGERRRFMSRTGATNLLEGQIFPKMGTDSLVFDARIINLKDGSRRASFGPVVCSVNDVMAGLGAISDEILGWWASRDYTFTAMPNYKAYQSYLRARSYWMVNDSVARSALEEAIRADPEFPEPYILLVSHYCNIDDFATADSILTLIGSKFARLSPRLNALVASDKAWVDGKLDSSFMYFQNELQYDSLDLFVNTWALIQSIDFVNAPQYAIKLVESIPPDSIDYELCQYCQQRLYPGAIAYHSAGMDEKALALLAYMPEKDFYAYELTVQILASQGDTASIQTTVSEALKSNISGAGRLYATAAWYFALQGKEIEKQQFAKKAIAVHGADVAYGSTLDGSYLLGQYEFPAKVFRAWMKDYPDNNYVSFNACRVFARAGDKEALEEFYAIADSMEINNRYHHGHFKYCRAVIAAIQGNRDKALDLLEAAYSEGQKFLTGYYQYDIDLKPLFDEPKFQEIIRPKNYN